MTRKRFYSILWSVAEVAVYPVIYMLSLPLFMRTLGIELFGVWMLVNTFLISGQLFNFGLGTATLRNVSRFLESKQPYEVSRTINSNLLSTFFIGLISLMVGLLLIAGIRYGNWFSFREAYQETVIRCILLIAPLLTLKFIEQILQSVLKAHEYFALASVLSMLSKFSLLGINVIMVLSGIRDLSWLFAANTVLLAIIILITMLMVRKVNPEIKYAFTISKSRIWEEMNFGKWTWLQSLMVILTYQGDRLLVMLFFGPATLAYYAVVSTMFNHIHMCFGALIPWMFPAISKMVERGEDTPQRYFKIRGFVLMMSILGLGLFYLVHPYLLTWWIGEANFAEMKSLIPLFILFELFFVFTIVAYVYCNSGGQEVLFTKITAVFTGLNLAGMFGGIWMSGTVEGMVWGMVVTTIPGMMIQNHWMNKKLFGEPVWQELIRIFLPAIFMALAIVNADAWIRTLAVVLALTMLYRIYIIRLFPRHVIAG